MERAIIGYHQDSDGVWVAELACGHPQHVRHEPPWQSRPWVISEEGRRAQLGALLDCAYCNMAALPAGVVAYKRTPSFTNDSVPAALLRDHDTKPGVWGQIMVEEGKLEYACDRGVFVLRPGIVGVIEPERLHHVRPLSPVRFFVEFLREPDPSAPAPQ